MSAYATSDEFEAWLRRPEAFTTAERRWVDDSLDVAAILIRNNVDMTDVVLGDEKYTVARRVSFHIVRPEFTRAWDKAGLAAWSESMGPLVESATVHNPDAELVFTEAHRAMFPGAKAATGPRWRFGDDCG